MIAAVKDFFVHKRLLTQVNATNLTLIPKHDAPKTVMHFRPIACCNVVYKVISKLLCTRLALVLPHIIDKNQGAYIQGRNIQDNILICQDLVRLYERPNSSPRCLLKIDLQKAYDSVEWNFVDQMLDHLQFPLDFKTMIMECITSPSYSLSLNGEMFGFFKGKRGLRQGDPLSPLIFTICMEYLTRTLKYAAMRNNFGYHPMCKDLKLASLMFADDLLLFSRGDIGSMMLLLQAYSTFSKASGLVISPSKSNAYIRGVQEEIKQDFLRVSGFREGILPFNYLGMPIQTTRLQKRDCECLVEKICERIHRYGARRFSYAGRLVLVKAVLTALHSYWASLFILPKGVIARIESTCRNFLWDSSPDYRRAPLVAWSTICQPKEEGGLGIRNQELSNLSMIGKLVNWVAEKRDSIWVDWVYANHIKDQNWMAYEPGSTTSWVWKKICATKQKLQQGFTDGQWTIEASGYSPSGCYKWLTGIRPAVPWAKVVWNDWVTPKHQFIGWLYAHRALQTNDKMLNYGAEVPDTCYLCGHASETLDHLFLRCVYSQQITRAIHSILQIHIPETNLFEWCMNEQNSITQQGIRAALTLGVCYHTWVQRNKCRVEHKLKCPKIIAQQILNEIRQQMCKKEDKGITIEDKTWLRSLNIM
ncbi:hypothetical protein vseg_003556 [Gypsophila vaccaria]